MKNSGLYRVIQKCMKINNDLYNTYEVRRNSFKIKSYFNKESDSFSVGIAVRK